jgi:hypothetical protein
VCARWQGARLERQVAAAEARRIRATRVRDLTLTYEAPEVFGGVAARLRRSFECEQFIRRKPQRRV